MKEKKEKKKTVDWADQVQTTESVTAHNKQLLWERLLWKETEANTQSLTIEQQQQQDQNRDVQKKKKKLWKGRRRGALQSTSRLRKQSLSTLWIVAAYVDSAGAKERSIG